MLTIKQKMGYGLGDLASNIVFQIAANFMLFYYTDVVGLAAGAAGTMMLVVRFLDAFTDPVMGAVADRTRTRWGAYRPYLVWMAFPFGLLAVLAFSVPDISDNGKLIYAYITYSLLMLVYTAINIPYSALGGVLSEESKDRTDVQSFRFAGAMVGNLLIVGVLLTLVDYLGGDDQAKGFQYAVAIMAVLAIACFFLCFATTKERVAPPKKVVKSGILQDALSLFKNDQFLLIALIAVFLLVLVGIRSAVSPYYVKYVLQKEEWISFYLTTGAFAALFGALFTSYASKLAEKKKLFVMASIAVGVLHLVLFFVPGELFYVSLGVFILINFAQMVLTPLMFAMVADTVDYGALKTGQKIMGMTYSGHLLAIKIGFALGGAMSGWVLSGFGYQANVEQTAGGIMGIMTAFALVPVICCALIVVVSLFYKLTDKRLEEVHEELHKSSDVAQPGFSPSNAS